MADQWIDAAAALDLIKNPMAICERCHAGLIRSRANVLTSNEEKVHDVEVPRRFWWAEGHAALQQNWITGDFSTWIDGTHARAFGVSFALDDLLTLIPFDQQAEVRRRLSVAGNPAWVSAVEARRFVHSDAGLPPTSAGSAIIQQCRLGFILGRAVEMRLAGGTRPDDWTREAREWDIPTWFWERFTAQESSRQDWVTGVFSGQGRAPTGHGSMTLTGVHFLRSSLDVLKLTPASAEPDLEPQDAKKPPLPEAALGRWWEKLAAAREALSQDELWMLAKAAHPEHSVSRHRIRALAEGRTPGPKRK
jgi:hypothetical protein